ncbi:unnamed protein product [Zymoseptoria tritici ST99CH_3D7]|uniref:Uncharacterized protein n=1 Tax=Zymoseptoria tritici (strain ST99CH_3D7) TaxID=1276538 RepID=A0A1X7SAE7_ZYMT9|nr:unnamed protein product [Zymoseptoria tritici ST99CH_3D7]
MSRPKISRVYVYAVGWDVSDGALFEVLGKKLLSWTQRWVTNKNLSPGMIEEKIDPTKMTKIEWTSVWAAHTEAWTDPEFEFVLEHTSPKAPKGIENLPPRQPIPHPWKSPATLIEAAAEYLDIFGYTPPAEKKKTLQKTTTAQVTAALAEKNKQKLA